MTCINTPSEIVRLGMATILVKSKDLEIGSTMHRGTVQPHGIFLILVELCSQDNTWKHFLCVLIETVSFMMHFPPHVEIIIVVTAMRDREELVGCCHGMLYATPFEATLL